ncbi:hypothetical protein L9F63_016872, partial [Diploptera punctata]
VTLIIVIVFRSLSPSSVASGRPVLCRFLAVSFLLLQKRQHGYDWKELKRSIIKRLDETAVLELYLHHQEATDDGDIAPKLQSRRIKDVKDAYVNKQLEGIRLKILRDDGSCGAATKLISWLKGAFDAFTKKYLRQLTFNAKLQETLFPDKQKSNASYKTPNIQDDEQSTIRSERDSTLNETTISIRQPDEALSAPSASPAQPFSGIAVSNAELTRTPTEVRQQGVFCACGVEKDGGLMVKSDIPPIHRKEICLYRRTLR